MGGAALFQGGRYTKAAFCGAKGRMVYNLGSRNLACAEVQCDGSCKELLLQLESPAQAAAQAAAGIGAISAQEGFAQGMLEHSTRSIHICSQVAVSSAKRPTGRRQVATMRCDTAH